MTENWFSLYYYIIRVKYSETRKKLICNEVCILLIPRQHNSKVDQNHPFGHCCLCIKISLSKKKVPGQKQRKEKGVHSHKNQIALASDI